MTLLSTCVICSFNIYRHLEHYNKPTLQKQIVRILGVVPVYALGSFLSVAYREQSLYFDTIRDMYEALVIYAFLILIIAYGGGENTVINAIGSDPGWVYRSLVCSIVYHQKAFHLSNAGMAA